MHRLFFGPVMLLLFVGCGDGGGGNSGNPANPWYTYLRRR